MQRKSGLNLDGYKNYIAPYNIEKLSRRHHPLGKMPVYPRTKEPDVWFEETLAEERYKNLVDEWARITGEDRDNLIKPGVEIMMELAMHCQRIMFMEYGKYRQLERIAETTIREYFHLSESEVLFDIEILDPTSGRTPATEMKFNNGEEDEIEVHDPSFEPDFRDELIRRRLTNALIQGSSLKGHFMFHMAGESLNALMRNATSIYSRAMITNDLLYYYNDDVIFSRMTEGEQQSGGMEIDYSGEVPVIRCKAMLFTVLMHEMIKGVTEVLFSVGLPKDPAIAEKVIDFSDTVMNEFWDIRLGPKMWEMFYALLDQEDHEFLKHVIVGIAQLDTPDFLAFMKNMFTNHPDAKTVINTIIKEKRQQIADYSVDGEQTVGEEGDDINIDWGSLGL